MTRTLVSLAAVAISATAVADDEDITEITVEAQRVANERPASGFATLATELRFDPLTELQSRGLPEGQADVTVRGGVFENTGFQVGAVTITDPQTGHYFAELPIDPRALTRPEVTQGVDNAIYGFNSNIATVRYAFTPMRDGGSMAAGLGSDALNFQSLRFATTADTASGATGFAVSAARSEGDGTVDNGDHEFQRFNLHWQTRSDGAQTDIVVARQDKFYGWPGAYTGFRNLLETDDTETTLLLASHRRDTDGGFLELSAYTRKLVNDYDFDRTTRESGAPGSFDHVTRVSAFGLQGAHRSGAINWRFGGQLTADKLERSTDLTNGDFTERSYLKLSVVPEYEQVLDSRRLLTLSAGLSVDASNRDSNRWSPLLGLRLENDAVGSTLDLQYTETTQLPGYTVLQSRPAGLFGGNASLGREEAKQWSLSYGRESTDMRWHAAVFTREDVNLVDWTYSSAAPFARQANAVDIDVVGIEAFMTREYGALNVVGGFTWLDKDADYGDAAVDASFYALNYAEQRLTLAVSWSVSDTLDLRLDNEYRDQADNPLRASADSAWLASLSLNWMPMDGLRVSVAADNLFDDDFEFFPGTPGVGRQLSLAARYDW